MSLIQRAAADGLDPSDYRAAELGELAGRLGAQRRGDSAEAIRFDLALSGDMLRYFRQLHQGRIDARLLGLDIPGPAHRHDYAAWLRSTVDGNRLASVADDLAPPLAQYRNLRVMLAKYRAIADAPGRAPLPAFPAVLRPGDAWAGSPALQELLVALGDVPPDAPAPVSGVYEGAVVAGVERFQDRHGLAPDGVLGKTTQATLPGDSVGNDPLVGGFRSPSGTTVRQRR